MGQSLAPTPSRARCAHAGQSVSPILGGSTWEKGEKPRPGKQDFKPLRQIIESVNDTLKGQLDLERHGGRTIAGVCARITQRILALTAAIWHNDNISADIRRSLIAYDH